VNVPSYSVRVGDMIQIREASKETDRIKNAIDAAKQRTTVRWLSVDHDNMTAKVTALPGREDVDQTIQEQLIVEFYSR